MKEIETQWLEGRILNLRLGNYDCVENGKVQEGIKICLDLQDYNGMLHLLEFMFIADEMGVILNSNTTQVGICDILTYLNMCCIYRCTIQIKLPDLDINKITIECDDMDEPQLEIYTNEWNCI